MEIKRKTAAGGAAISVFLRSLVCALGFSLLYAVPRGSLQPQAATGFLLWSDALSMSGVLVLLLAGAFRLAVAEWRAVAGDAVLPGAVTIQRGGDHHRNSGDPLPFYVQLNSQTESFEGLNWNCSPMFFLLQ